MVVRPAAGENCAGNARDWPLYHQHSVASSIGDVVIDNPDDNYPNPPLLSAAALELEA